MQYESFDTKAQAKDRVRQHEAQGRRAYWLELCAGRFEVRSWTTLKRRLSLHSLGIFDRF